MVSETSTIHSFRLGLQHSLHQKAHSPGQGSTWYFYRFNPLFTPFKKKSLAKVKKELANANRYSSAFIESVVGGLAKSSLYKNKK